MTKSPRKDVAGREDRTGDRLLIVIAEIYVFCFIQFVSNLAGDHFTELQFSSHHTHK